MTDNHNINMFHNLGTHFLSLICNGFLAQRTWFVTGHSGSACWLTRIWIFPWFLNDGCLYHNPSMLQIPVLLEVALGLSIKQTNCQIPLQLIQLRPPSTKWKFSGILCRIIWGLGGNLVSLEWGLDVEWPSHNLKVTEGAGKAVLLLRWHKCREFESEGNRLFFINKIVPLDFWHISDCYPQYLLLSLGYDSGGKG